MSDGLRFGLIVVAAIVVLIFLVDAWFKEKRNVKMARSIPQAAIDDEEDLATPSFTPRINFEEAPIPEKKPTLNKKDEFIVLRVIAKPGSHFGSYELLQTISAAGLQFGEMNIFHYYQETLLGRKTLFSLASATEPGDFDLNNMGEFSCAGLTLFMNLRALDEPNDVFILMLETAQQLADDLGGDVLAADRKLWSPDLLSSYQKRIEMYAYS